jgi:hypothetical protein
MGILIVNGASIVATTLDFTTILNILTCISKPFVDKWMDKSWPLPKMYLSMKN